MTAPDSTTAPPKRRRGTAYRRTEACDECGQLHPDCTAHNKAKGPCGEFPQQGQTVCHLHGGKAPQSKDRAKLRILEALDPVAARLVKIALKEPDPRVALKAIDSVLDRGGLGRYAGVTLTDADGEPVPIAVQAQTLAAELAAFQAGVEAQRGVQEA